MELERLTANNIARNYFLAKEEAYQAQPKLSQLLMTVPEKPMEWQLTLMHDIILDVLQNKDVCDSTRFHLLQGAYGIGKTTFGALLTLAHFYQFGFLDRESGYKGNIVSGSLIQLTTVTCAVLREILTQSAFGNYFTMTGNQIYLNVNPNKFIRFCVCNTSNMDSFAGIHKANGYVYNFFDEGTAIHDKAYDIAETFMDKGNCTWVVTGNPTTTKGEFYRKSTSPKWNVAKVTRFDFWGLEDQWAKDMEIEYGVNSDTYRMKVLAEFPMNSTNNVISIHTFKEAEKRGKQYTYSKLKEYECGPVVIMVDPSTNAGVCDHGICIRDHICVREIYPIQGDIDELAEHVASLTEHYKVMKIFLDSICCGWGVDTRIKCKLGLRGITHIPIAGVDNRRSPSHNTFCANKRAENIMEGKKWLEAYGGIAPTPYMDRFFNELMQVTYEENALNVKLAKKEGIQDLADAFWGTFEEPLLLVNLAAQQSTHIIQRVMHNEYSHNNYGGIIKC
jgi:hypothetical protein